jgi:ABC-type glycerol-3-phosphate transport system substrate-binding protein
MKKLSMFQIILLVVFGGLAIAGILIFALAVGGGTTNTVGPITIWGTLNQTAFTTVIRDAADTNSSLSQVTYVQKDQATYESDLTKALASGTGPDLFLLRQDYAVKDAGEIDAIPSSVLSQSQFESTFVDAASPFVASNGILGVPILADPLVLYWNKDMLSSGGFSEPPQYWDQLFGMAQKLSQKNDAGDITQSAIALGEYQNVDNAKDILTTLILQAGGSITAYDTAGHLEPALQPKSSDTSQSTASALRFFTEFADPTMNDYSWNRSLPSASQDFASGDLAMYIGYASEEPTIAAMNPNLNFAAAPLPQVRGASRTLDTAHVYAFAIARTSADPSAAASAAFLLASAANSQAISTSLGIPSARRDVLALPAQGNDDLFNKMVITSHSWVDPDPVATATLFQAMIENTTSGAALLSDAVQRADQQMGHILGLCEKYSRLSRRSHHSSR